MTKKLLSLEFFSDRFGLDVKDLSYGTGQAGEEIFPVILINDKNFFINIYEDKFCPKHLPNINIILENCQFTELAGEYLFESSISIILQHHQIEEFYSLKYFCPGTKRNLCK